MSVGIGIIGRERILNVGGQTLVGVQTKGMAINNEILDTTDDAASGWIEKLAVVGSKSVSFSIEGLLKNLELVRSNNGLVGIEKEFYNPKAKNRELVLKEKIKEVSTKFDFIIIDSPPALGPITINALSASDSVIIPIQCEFFALEGLAQLLNTVSLLKKTINPKLKIKGFLPTMYSGQNNLSKQVLADLSHHFKDKLFHLKKGKECIVVPRNVKIAESPSFGKPVTSYAINSKGSIAYRNLATVIARG